MAIIGLAGAASALNPALSAAAASAGIPFIDPFNTAVSAIVTEQATTGSYDVAGTDLLPFTIVLSPFSATPKVASLAALAFPGTGPCGFNPATNGIGCATPAYAEPFAHYDGVHPNTLYMGVVGNQIVTRREHHVRVRDADHHRTATARHRGPVAARRGGTRRPSASRPAGVRAMRDDVRARSSRGLISPVAFRLQVEQRA